MTTFNLSGTAIYAAPWSATNTVRIPAGATAWTITWHAPFAGTWSYLSGFWRSVPYPTDPGACAAGSYNGTPNTATTFSDSGTLPMCSPPATYLGVSVWPSSGQPNGGTWTATISFNDPPPAYGPCAYGSSVQAGAPAEVWVTADMLRTALGTTVSEQLPRPTFTFGQQLYSTASLCATQPALPPVITDGDILLAQSNPVSWLALMNKVGAWRDSWAFSQYCQCNAPPTGGGSNTLQPPPTPSLPNTPVLPLPTGCSTDTLCQKLDEILWVLQHPTNPQVSTQQSLTTVQSSVQTTLGDAVSNAITGIGAFLKQHSNDEFGYFNPTGGPTCDLIDVNISNGAYWGLRVNITTRPDRYIGTTPDNEWSLADLAVIRLELNGELLERHPVHMNTYEVQPLPRMDSIPILDHVMPTAPVGYHVIVQWALGVCGSLELQYIPDEFTPG
ncbi:MAG TPA: hypothetical protein VF748_14490 [Candidatus Acidoferrum sp.]